MITKFRPSHHDWCSKEYCLSHMFYTCSHPDGAKGLRSIAYSSVLRVLNLFHFVNLKQALIPCVVLFRQRSSYYWRQIALRPYERGQGETGSRHRESEEDRQRERSSVLLRSYNFQSHLLQQCLVKRYGIISLLKPVWKPVYHWTTRNGRQDVLPDFSHRTSL